MGIVGASCSTSHIEYGGRGRGKFSHRWSASLEGDVGSAQEGLHRSSKGHGEVEVAGMKRYWAVNGMEPCNNCNRQFKIYVEGLSQPTDPPGLGSKVKFVCPGCGKENEIRPGAWGGPEFTEFQGHPFLRGEFA
jgi:hypothetical protein